MKPLRAVAPTSPATYPVLEHMAVLTDPLRCRILLLLEAHELTVGELCAVLQLPQSTVSRHLKTLADGGWLGSRREATSRYYGIDSQALDAGARRLWPLVREQMSSAVAAERDARRLKTVLARRRSRSQAFFSAAAGDWDHLRATLFGESAHVHALLGLLDPALTVGDLGCGTGQVSALVAPHVGRVVAVDGSSEMLEAARARLADASNVDLRRGELEALPIADGELDAAIVALVLHHVSDPGRVLGEVARVLRPGGRVLLLDMLPHDRAEFHNEMGHVWLGFPEPQMRKLMTSAGFGQVRVTPVPPDPDASGPPLFAAAAIRPADAARAT